jgi:hypothetical protein
MTPRGFVAESHQINGELLSVAGAPDVRERDRLALAGDERDIKVTEIVGVEEAERESALRADPSIRPQRLVPPRRPPIVVPPADRVHDRQQPRQIRRAPIDADAQHVNETRIARRQRALDDRTPENEHLTPRHVIDRGDHVRRQQRLADVRRAIGADAVLVKQRVDRRDRSGRKEFARHVLGP